MLYQRDGYGSKPIETHTLFPSSRDEHPFTSYFDAYHGTTVLTDSRNLMVGVLVSPNKHGKHQIFPINK